MTYLNFEKQYESKERIQQTTKKDLHTSVHPRKKNEPAGSIHSNEFQRRAQLARSIFMEVRYPFKNPFLGNLLL